MLTVWEQSPYCCSVFALLALSTRANRVCTGCTNLWVTFTERRGRTLMVCPFLTPERSTFSSSRFSLPRNLRGSRRFVILTAVTPVSRGCAAELSINGESANPTPSFGPCSLVAPCRQMLHKCMIDLLKRC